MVSENPAKTESTFGDYDTGWRFWRKRRHIVSLLSFFGFFNLYALRANLSVAIVSMTAKSSTISENGTIVEDAEFDWDSQLQGYVLSSFYYGYIATQILGGYLSAKFGGKIIFGISIATTSTLTLLTPLCASLNVYLLLAVRILEGISEGVCYPCMHSILSKWAPPDERNRMATIAFSGSNIGTVVSMPASALLADALGWRWIFYFFGTLGICWTILWWLVISSSPEQDKHISDKELEYITESLRRANCRPIGKIPWVKILKSVPVWAVTISITTYGWGNYTMLTELPSFLSDVTDYSLNTVGFITAIPYLCMPIAMQIAGRIADHIKIKGLMKIVHMRKMFNCGAFLVAAAFMVATAFVSSELGKIVCLTIAVAATGVAWIGFGVNPLDLAPQYASILMGLNNTFATFSGIISPILTGYIVKNKTPEEWRTVFLIASGVYVVGSILYGLLASSDLQSWAIDDTPTEPPRSDKEAENKTDIC